MNDNVPDLFSQSLGVSLPRKRAAGYMEQLKALNNRQATPAEIEAQRAGYANYQPGPRNCMPMRTPYVSIDIETTGLNSDTCQVIEFGAVFDDWVTPVEQLPRLHRYLYHDQITGEPYALAMNSAILRRLSQRDESCVRASQLASHFVTWLLGVGAIKETSQAFIAAGKNFAGFDKRFLLRLPGFDGIHFHHRSIDPCMLFWRPDVDAAPPSSKTCMERAGIAGEVAHTAVEDAVAVIQMVRAAFEPAANAKVVADKLVQQFHDNGQFSGQ